MNIRTWLYGTNFLNKIKFQKTRDAWVKQVLLSIAPGSRILDAGCGSQRYRSLCEHLDYSSQDFGGYVSDEKKGLEHSIGEESGYEYGELTYQCDICAIPEDKDTFDAILCTEVLEHLPNPLAAVEELVRLLKPGAILIITAPTHSLKHMDPYHFYTGFTDRFYEHIAEKYNLALVENTPNQDYYRVMAMELARSASFSSFFWWPILVPAFLFFYFARSTRQSRGTYTYGYHTVFRKREI